MNEEQDFRSVHVPESCGWGCFVVVLLVLAFGLRGCG